MGEYEPNDSRNVTGAGNQQGHGQDPGVRSQAQRQQSGQQAGGPGQMGGSARSGGQPQQFQSGEGQMGGGSGFQGTAAGGMRQQAASGSPFAGQVREHMDVIGADGTHVGTVDHVDGDRIKLTRRDSGAGYEGGQHSGHHHYLSLGLVAGVEGNTVRLSANGDVAYGMEEEEGGQDT